MVVGAGGAGLYAALTAALEGARVVLVAATPLAQTASYWAQGGLAAALAADDSPDIHRQDTETAGRGAVRRSAANVLVREAPHAVDDLQRLGVRFDADRRGRLALSLEGGHSRRRVAHAGGSATGRRVVRQLSAVVAEDPRITVLEPARAAAAWTVDGRCVGVVLEDGRAIHARASILATGGAAALWSRTTNPPGSLGIGMLLAHDAGAALADLEFVQFHPTAVTGIPGREGFLVTEAIRGEGATLHDARGERFVEELAPRDEVSRAVHQTMREQGVTHVDLDMREVDMAKFPNVVDALRESGLDPATTRIPVAPASHYVMGGVVADLDGATTVPGLYAVGESSCTGLHGANRLASNSLSECFVWGRRAALAGLTETEVPAASLPAPPAAAPIQKPSRATQEALWTYAGIERTREGLEHLLTDPHPLARLVARCALLREETRGSHRRSDFPETDPALDGRHAVVRGEHEPVSEPWI
ncbi:FAD-dependent oxidoreductase [Paraconexibacter antarcticus]|uniref:L-aspartate oxidase n=1 Tax=Paraconexibacter antarcticus TaxID=2949664 RepID=A0ABY5DY54_9ACTN|nr:FAD-binding protein [Paraconexibacter antarcticus]UTI66966.1 FAD-dependent oxidoreductase [Paraconexibacter antarcticus]